MTEIPAASTTSDRQLPTGTRWILGLFTGKLAIDIYQIITGWPEFSPPKLGIAIAAPFVMWGLVKHQRWAMSLAGVICFFWLAFLVARTLGPMLTIGPMEVAFPWSNLVSIPCLVLVMNGMTSDGERPKQ